jgi:transglutaminase-like putative cysteine protease
MDLDINFYEDSHRFTITSKGPLPLIEKSKEYFKVLKKIYKKDQSLYIYKILVKKRRDISRANVLLPLKVNSYDLREKGLLNSKSEEVQELIEDIRRRGGVDRFDLLLDTLLVIEETLTYSNDFPEVIDLPTIIKRGSGECHHYSALAVTLLRAVGVPARMISGRAMRNQHKGSHMWIEVNLDGTNWMPVEPQLTTGRLMSGSLYFPLVVDQEYVDDDSRGFNPVCKYDYILSLFDFEIIQEGYDK